MNTADKALLGMLGTSAMKKPQGQLHIPYRIKELYEHLNNLPPGGLDQELHGQHRPSRSIAEQTTYKPTYKQAYIPPGQIIRTFYDKDKIPDDTDVDTSQHTNLQFDISSITAEETLYSAELHVMQSHNDVTNRTLVPRLNVYQQVKTSSGEIQQVMVDSKDLLPTKASAVDEHGTWHTLDVTDVVRQWREKEQMDNILDVEILNGEEGNGGVRIKRSADTEVSEWKSQQPYLITFSDDKDAQKEKQSRQRRSANTRKRKNRKKRVLSERKQQRKRLCKRKPLVVNFEEIGWKDWIIAPLEYNAFYCEGECPYVLPDHMNTTNHAIIQSFVHAVKPNTTPKPCCVPTELSDLSMLIFTDDNSIKLKTFRNMVVEGCGCR